MKKTATLNGLQAADELGVTYRTLFNYIHGRTGHHRLPATKDAAGNLVIRRTDLEAFRKRIPKPGRRPKPAALHSRE